MFVSAKAIAVLPPAEVLGKRLATERERLGYTVDEASRLTGISPSEVRRLETFCRPPLSTVLQFVRLAGYSVVLILPELFAPVGPYAVPPKKTRVPAHRLRAREAKAAKAAKAPPLDLT